MNEDELRHLRRAIGTWAKRPPRLPPRVARTRVVARLAEARKPSAWRVAVALASAVAVLALGLLFLAPEHSSEPAAVAMAERPAPGLLVYELRSGSKLYFALAARPSHPPTVSNRKQQNGE